METNVPRMDIAEFRRLGLLQEVNRLFFHPRGLALESVIEEDGSERLGGVWDYREDPEGMAFGDDMISQRKARTVSAMLMAKMPAREKLFGTCGGIQPVPDHETEEACCNGD